MRAKRTVAYGLIMMIFGALSVSCDSTPDTVFHNTIHENVDLESAKITLDLLDEVSEHAFNIVINYIEMKDGETPEVEYYDRDSVLSAHYLIYPIGTYSYISIQVMAKKLGLFKNQIGEVGFNMYIENGMIYYDAFWEIPITEESSIYAKVYHYPDSDLFIVSALDALSSN